MVEDEYLRWVEFHVRVFGLPGEAVDGILGWRPSFIDGGYTTQELALASRRMVLESPAPRWLSEHLTRLNGHVRAIKAEVRAEAERKGFRKTLDDPRGYCEFCSGGGLVVVPHPDYVRGNEWVPHHANLNGDPVRPYSAVKCSCERGRFLKGHEMTLEAYRAKIHPDPFQLMRMNEPVRQPTSPDAGALVKRLAAEMRA